MPLIALEELGLYARWVFDNVERGNGMTLKLGTGRITSAGLVKGFATVIGRTAAYKSLTFDRTLCLEHSQTRKPRSGLLWVTKTTPC
jgi:hypothetical protein